MAFRTTFNFLKQLPKVLSVRTAIPMKTLEGLSKSPSNLFNSCSIAIPFSANGVSVFPRREFHLLRQLTPQVTKELFPCRNECPGVDQKRSITMYGFNGKRKTVKSILKRFYRLDWGIWIRPRAGRGNKIWRKGPRQVQRSRTHVFCNSQQSYMLDKMVGHYWHRKKYFVDDPYESYHTRPDFWITKRR